MEIKIPTAEEIRTALAQGESASFDLMDGMKVAIETLVEHVKKQAELIQVLKARLDKDSHNSSKPPSTDGYKKPAPQSLRKPGQKPNGGQPGHKGNTLEAKEHPDHREEYLPGCCAGCQKDLSEIAVSGGEARQVFEIPVMRIEVTEHVAQAKVCPTCGTVNKGEFPPEVDAAVQYGNSVTSFCAYLNNQHYIPLERTTQLFQDLFQHRLSEAFVLKATHAVSECIKPAEDAVKACLAASEVVHVDETGIRVKGKLHWVHAASTNTLTNYAVHAKRGTQAMNEVGIIPQVKGTLVHDHWKPYFQYTECDHGACNAHQLRELVGIAESWQQPWATQMISVLCDIKNAVDAAKKDSATELPKEIKAQFVNCYEAVLADGYAANPLPTEVENAPPKKGPKKQSPPRNLLDRLKNFQQDTLRFMNDFSVPFDNNLSERDIRMIKTKMKVSGTFRTLTGAEQFVRIRGYISTARKNGLNILGSIKDALTGKPFIPASA